jgi:hypothetical protein
VIEIEYGNKLWLDDKSAANAEAVRRACLHRDAADIEDRRAIYFSDLGALTILPQELAEIEGLERLIVGDAETPGGYFDLIQTLADVSVLSKLTTLVEINLRDSRFETLPSLSGLTSLQNLDLSLTGVSDVGALSGLTSLQSLNLSHTRVRDVGALSGLTSLQSLDLSRTGVSDVGALSGLTSLQSLDLLRTGVSDVGALSGLTSLQSLDLGGTGVSDVGALSGLTSLQSLDLSNTSVSDVGALSGLTSLQSLNLLLTGVSDVTVLLNLPRFVALDGTFLNIAGTPLARQDRRWEMLAGLSPDRQATDVVLYLQGKHPDLQPPEGGGAQPAGAAAIEVRSPVRVVAREGLAELEDAVPGGSQPPVPVAGASEQIAVVHGLADGLIGGLELGSNVPPLLLQRLKWYRAVADPSAAPVLSVLESVMVVLRGTVGDSYIRSQLDDGTCDGLDYLVCRHDDIGVPPAIEDPRPAVPHVPQTPDAQAGVIAQVEALHQVLRDTREGGLTGNTFVIAIESTVDVVNTANSPTIHAPSPREETERKGMWAWSLRMVAGMSQGLETFGKVHGWSTTPMGAAILQRLADIVQKLMGYFT